MLSKGWLVCALAVVLFFSLLGSYNMIGAAPPIKIGYLGPFTGPWTSGGTEMRDAWILHIGQIGSKVAGRDIQFIAEDDEGKPEVGLTKTRKLVEKDKVHILTGIYSSGVAYAVRDYVHSQKVPLMITNAGADDLTQQKRSPYIFRSSYSNSQHNFAFGAWVYNKLGKRRLVMIGSEFPGAWEWCGAMAYSFVTAGGKVLQELYSPLGANDYAPYITAIKPEADVVYTMYTGHEAVRFHTQYKEYGLYGKIQNVGVLGGMDEYVYPQCGDDVVGYVSTGLRGYPDDPAYKAYRQAFREKFGRDPGNFADGAYMGAMFVLRALQKINGNIEDKEAFLNALKGIKIPNSGWGPISFDEYQNTVHDVPILKLIKVGNTFKVEMIDVVPQVSQFWHFTPEEYFKKVPNWAQMKGKWADYKPVK